MWNFLRQIRPRRARSGTPKFPKPVDVFNVLINDLMDLDEWDKASFVAKKCKWRVEVQPDKSCFLVMITYPFSDSPESLFMQKKVGLPSDWNIKKFRKKKKVTLSLEKSNKNSIAPFLDLIFRRLYNCPDNYSVFGKLVLGFWQY